MTAKCSVEKRSYPPGLHGNARTRVTEYGLQLREKQRVKRSCFMSEKQFRRFFNISDKEEGPTGANLLINLECRLDNVVRQLGYAESILQARQRVLHGHIKVNGKRMNIPSYIVKEADEVTVNEKSKDIEKIKESLEKSGKTEPPEWIERDSSVLKGKIKRKPSREEITIGGGDIKENLIVELYSK